MIASVSHYPRVSEWVYVGDTAVNMAQVASIAFATDERGGYAVLRLSGGDYQYEVHDPALLRYLREYVAHMIAPGLEKEQRR